MEIKLLVFFCIISGAALVEDPTNLCQTTIMVQAEKYVTYSATCLKQTSWLFIRYTKKYSCQKQKKITTLVSRQIEKCCPGYLNVSGNCMKAPCNSTTFGDNCTLPCPCEAGHYNRCDMNGTCLCSPGWIGNNCSKPCEPEKYGENCQWNCSCENNATCNHVTGRCDCSSVEGWIGESCDKECPEEFYGRNCSLPCNCSDFQDPVCHPVSGRCVCISGKRGENCSLDCGEFNFGPNCDDTCDCMKNNSNECNSSTGDCVCKTGWVGDRCEQRCDPFHYGTDCDKNCTCNATEICDNVNGTCLSANICFSEFSLNCLSSFTLTCKQLIENCTDSDATDPSLTKDMLDICCEKRDSLNVSLCIAEGECNCRSGYSSKACNETIASQSDGKVDGTPQSNGVSSVVVSVVTVILVLLIAVLVVIIVFWRRKYSINKKQKSKSAHNPAHANFDKVQGQRPERKSQEESQTEMHALNESGTNNYGYDVTVRNSRNDENENYAATNAGEAYDHLERSSAQKSNKLHTDDTYSHAQPDVVDEDEYNTAGGRHVPSDSVYDHTENPSQMYSNTGDLRVHGVNTDDEYI